jgi:hypothetical protein
MKNIELLQKHLDGTVDLSDEMYEKMNKFI